MPEPTSIILLPHLSSELSVHYLLFALMAVSVLLTIVSAALLRRVKRLKHRLFKRKQQVENVNGRLFEAIARHEISQELVSEAQDYLHSILNSMPSMLIGITDEGAITHWNNQAEQSTGVCSSSALGKDIHQTYPELPLSPARLREIIANGDSKSFESIQHGKGSLAAYQDIVIYPLQGEHQVNGAVIRIDDVTVRVNLENMMMQHEKMKSLGELAAGLAHELNNPLGAILQNLQTVERRLQTGLTANQQCADQVGISLGDLNHYMANRDIPLLLNHIREAGNRASQIISNMLEFSRSNELQSQSENFIDLVDATLAMASLTIKQDGELAFSDIVIHRHYPKQAIYVNCSASGIQQVLLNLFSNCSQAFADDENLPNKTPTISLTIEQRQQQMVMTVTDNGPGIEAAAIRHIFDPFFTTKSVGRGTGLGLSVSYFIITQRHNGHFHVQSEPGKGCSFEIILPL
ncbi:two-component system sensor histidine kinase NtrB [Sinobacterium norvegicum]|uniref:two-component system sensor histidine kinase NtrB n=1 Tax=Sinobacterium norvegicum TaxID=1641715 RepID=UPI001F275F91|nr:ATP-binding protein [Sinobacterium norvegicum]